MSIAEEKNFNKIHHLFMIKSLKKLGVEGTFVNTIKAIYDKHVANIISQQDKLKSVALKSGKRQGCPLSPFLLNIALELLSRAVREEK
jgi:hypothetical protein